MDRRTEALAQLLETALSEEFATPVVELLAALPVPLAVLHAGDLRLLTINPALVELAGRPAAEVVGLPLHDVFPPSHPLADPRPYRHVIDGAPLVDHEVVIDGQPWRWFIRPLRGEHAAVFYLLTGLLAVGLQGSDLEASRLRESNAAKSDFLNMAAHELRTPLAVILGYGSLLAQGGLSSEHQQLAGLRVYEKGKQLSRLITDLTLIARFDELGPQLPTEEVDLAELTRELVEDLRRRHPDLAVEFVMEAPRAPARGNPDWLRLAVRELLDNAGRFRPQPAGRVDVSLTADGPSWVITVMDDGFGIEPTQLNRLFQRFSRIETDENRHLCGLGIGLYLVREVAQAHGGGVAVQSRPGLGSEFRFNLPQN
jgi:signal transduction histidine kinase